MSDVRVSVLSKTGVESVPIMELVKRIPHVAIYPPFTRGSLYQEVSRAYDRCYALSAVKPVVYCSPAVFEALGWALDSLACTGWRVRDQP